MHPKGQTAESKYADFAQIAPNWHPWSAGGISSPPRYKSSPERLCFARATLVPGPPMSPPKQLKYDYRLDATTDTMITRVWQDREIRFDVSPSFLKTRKGEEEIDSINSVEDTKGNNGHRGFLIVTNLRLLWASHKSAHTNLSIGLNCITSIAIKSKNSRLRGGSSQALFIMSKFNKSRYEFVFTSLVAKSPRLFTTVQAVSRAYETSKIYRDLKLRGAIIKDKSLIQVPGEQIFNHEQGVWNLSTDQGNLGSFFITNVRIVWHANLAQNFNVSIPYLQIKSLVVRNSPKFGPALVIETRREAGGYLLGFRIDPPSRLDEIFRAIASLYRVYAAKPNFGIQFIPEDRPSALENLTVARQEDKVEIIDSDEAMESLSAYHADYAGAGSGEIEYNEDLGLAMAALPAGFTPQNLWLLY